ncbi:MFS transporter [Christensenellaceae bacterium OttesenSCG-928-K19]|nr:MFS transporter [Christensenellaceae bacterium OttesenSCG-928-K19]
MATLFLLLIYLTYIALGLPDSLLGSVWPVMHTDLGTSFESAGIVSMVIAGGTIVSSLVSERLIRRFGTHRVSFVSVFATAGALLGYSLSPSMAMIALMAVPLGLGGGCIDSAMNNYVALHYEAKHMNWLHAFWGVGAFAGPLVMGVFMRQGDNWRGGYLAISIILFVIAILLTVSFPMWKKTGAAVTGKKQEGQAELPPPVDARTAIRIRGVLPAMATFLVYCAAEYTIGLWGSSFLVYVRGFAAADAAMGVSLYYIGITAGRFLSGFLTAKMSSARLIRTGVVMVMIGGGLLFIPGPFFMPLVAFFFLGFGCAPIFPSMVHETPARFGENVSQKLMGWQLASSYVGATFIPPLVGILGNNTSMMVVPILMLLYGVVLFACTERINKVAGAGKSKP